MINARRHTEKLLIYSILHQALTGCFTGNPALNEQALLDDIKAIKSAELDPKKSDKNMARALKLCRAMMSDFEGENGFKIILAINFFYQSLIDSGYEIFNEEDYAYQLWCELLSVINPDEQIDYPKKERKAKQIAEKWISLMNSEGYFI